MRKEVHGAPLLLNVCFRVRLQGVDRVGELDSVSDEEDREIVAHQIEVPLQTTICQVTMLSYVSREKSNQH